ncbi:MAG: hypothetical protein R8K20_05315 [Gallionellaceae bacterium]
MPLSNINARNHPASIKPVVVSAAETIGRKERPQKDPLASSVVRISTEARNMQRLEQSQKSSQTHIEKISNSHRSDQKALEKSHFNAQQETKVQEARIKVDQEFNKRINTQA